MKAETFFSEEFLNECERELVRLNKQLSAVSPFAHSSELSPDDIFMIAKFYNRLLFLLYHGKRIDKDVYYQGIEVVAYHHIPY